VNDAGDMFAPIGPLPNGSTAASSAPTAPEWRRITPVPEDAPPPPAAHPKQGRPAEVWDYHDAAGKLLGRVCRFELKEGGKDIRPLVFAEHKRHGRQWRWLHLPKPRPLYHLDQLAARPNAPVIVVEGEKAADAAGELLPDHVATTSSGGSKSARQADWRPLAGRRVTIWPDADEPGDGYARVVAELLAQLSPPPSVRIVAPPEGVALGWDAADARSEGWAPARAAKLVDEASPAAGAAASSEDGGGRRRRPARDGLLELIAEAELWHDPERIAFASILVGKHDENCEIASRPFRSWLAWRAYEVRGISPSGQAVEDAVRIAEGLALNRGPCFPTWRRVAGLGERIYLDLADAAWRAVEIDATGWRIVDQAPVKFLRSRGMLPLPAPEPGERIEALREFVNVEEDEKGDPDFRLLVAWLVATLRPSGPYPILMTSGQQGAAKSTLSRICRLLIDPNLSSIRSAPKDERDLIVSAFNSWFLAFDNLSGVPAWLSDALCRLSTGGGFATRQLHSDRDEQIFSAQRPIILNGIGDLGSRPDLADRAVSIMLPPLPEAKRRSEAEFWAAFEAARPGILGALLDGVSAGLRHLPAVKLDHPPRMADFATFVEAAAPGLGWEPGVFLRDYEGNRAEAVAAAADASPLIPAIEAVLGRTRLGAEGFDGTARELLALLCEVCSEGEQRARWFPRTDSHTGSALRRVAPLLEARGISVAHYKAGRERARMISLKAKIFDELRDRVRGMRPAARDAKPAPADEAPPPPRSPED
jgi:putative DNA primase/helicase